MTVIAPRLLKAARPAMAEKQKSRLLFQSALIFGAALSAFVVTSFH